MRYQPRKSPKRAPVVASERVRVVKGSRTPGFVEVRQGNVPERMAEYRQRPAKRVSQ